MARKRLPRPSSLSTVTFPPSRRAILREIESPSPVPPWRRAPLPSACVNGSNSLACCSGLMPIPVSTTSNAARSPSAPTFMRTSPSSVNLIALPTRLTRIWRARVASVQIAAGAVDCGSTIRRRPFACARWRSSSATSSASSTGEHATSSSESLPESIFAASSTSSRTRSRCSPLRWIVRSAGSARCALPASRSSRSSSAKPRIAVIGVRISWLIVARKSDFACAAPCASRRAASAAWRARCIFAHSMRWLWPAAAPSAPHTALMPTTTGIGSAPPAGRKKPEPRQTTPATPAVTRDMVGGQGANAAIVTGEISASTRYGFWPVGDCSPDRLMYAFTTVTSANSRSSGFLRPNAL